MQPTDHTGDWQLPGYRWVRLIGRGGFAVVHEAEQLSLGRRVAVKVLLADLSSPGDRRRFEREKTVMSRLSGHPHIVEVYDAGISPERRPFIVMRLYPRGNLATVVRERGPLPPAEAAELLGYVGEALDAAHSQGFLHRDVKPENILLSGDGRPALADFGIAALHNSVGPEKSSHSSTRFFTLSHVAPEILDRGEFSPASDIYALASTAFTVLAGRPPFDTSNPRIATLILDHEPAVPQGGVVPAAVWEAVLAGLSKDPQARPGSAAAFVEGLRVALEDSTGTTAVELPDRVPETTHESTTASIDVPRTAAELPMTRQVSSAGEVPTTAQSTAASIDLPTARLEELTSRQVPASEDGAIAIAAEPADAPAPAGAPAPAEHRVPPDAAGLADADATVPAEAPVQADAPSPAAAPLPAVVPAEPVRRIGVTGRPIRVGDPAAAERRAPRRWRFLALLCVVVPLAAAGIVTAVDRATLSVVDADGRVAVRTSWALTSLWRKPNTVTTDVPTSLLGDDERARLRHGIAVPDQRAADALIGTLRSAASPTVPRVTLVVGSYPRGRYVTIGWSDVDRRAGVTTALMVNGARPPSPCPQTLSAAGSCSFVADWSSSYSAAAVAVGGGMTATTSADRPVTTLAKPKVRVYPGERFTDKGVGYCEVMMDLDGLRANHAYKVKLEAFTPGSTPEISRVTLGATDAMGTLKGADLGFGYNDSDRKLTLRADLGSGLVAKISPWGCR